MGRARGRDQVPEAGAPIGAGAAHVASASTADVAASRPRRYPPGVAGLVARAKALFTWWQETRPARALARFGSVGGGVLTGGIAYSALFSVFAAVTLGYTAFMTVLGGNEALRAEVLATADSYLPGLIGGEGKRGLIDPRDLVVGSGLSLAGIAAVVVLVYSATVAMAALRTAVRAVSGVGAVGTNLLLGKARELAGMVGVGLAVLLSTIVTLAVTAASDWLLRLLGLEAVRGAVSWAVGAGVALAVDAGMFVLVVVVLAGVHPGRRDLLEGAVLAGVGIGVVRLLGTSVVAGTADRNALLASFAVLVTLLVWINLIARIVLLAAAWTADPPRVRPPGEDGATREAGESTG